MENVEENKKLRAIDTCLYRSEAPQLLFLAQRTIMDLGSPPFI